MNEENLNNIKKEQKKAFRKYNRNLLLIITELVIFSLLSLISFYCFKEQILELAIVHKSIIQTLQIVAIVFPGLALVIYITPIKFPSFLEKYLLDYVSENEEKQKSTNTSRRVLFIVFESLSILLLVGSQVYLYIGVFVLA